MKKNIATTIFESLSSGVRLDVYRLLVRQGKAGLVAGEIASQLSIAPSNLSFHLKSMVHANVVTVEQEGRFMRYRANMSLMLDLVAYLTEECCEGNLTECLDARDASACSPASSCCPPQAIIDHQESP